MVRPCQREAAVSRPSAAKGWQGAPATSTIVRCALSTAADLTTLGYDYFLLQTRVGQRSRSTLGSGACDRATRTPHSTPHARTTQRVPVAAIDTLRMTAVEHRAHTPSSSSSSSGRALFFSNGFSHRSRSYLSYFAFPVFSFSSYQVYVFGFSDRSYRQIGRGHTISIFFFNICSSAPP